MNSLERSRKFLQHGLTKPGTVEDYPFGPEVVVLKVSGKMFALFSRRDGTVQLALKCDPDRAEDLRRQYPQILPGYHLNKKHWNTLLLDGRLTDSLVRDLLDHSYGLVVAGLPRRLRLTSVLP
ncbi:MAG TPA: MmcQ/YjbR family DNA-binding protein [Patescibacteria group bacterium]|nr:MmcQ/YjbR family DNA-binding protein [Patescibacteria group bacterium]